MRIFGQIYMMFVWRVKLKSNMRFYFHSVSAVCKTFDSNFTGFS